MTPVRRDAPPGASAANIGSICGHPGTGVPTIGKQEVRGMSGLVWLNLRKKVKKGIDFLLKARYNG